MVVVVSSTVSKRLKEEKKGPGTGERSKVQAYKERKKRARRWLERTCSVD